jgi:pimeloyl-ACP methyl ester carboxylesterase
MRAGRAAVAAGAGIAGGVAVQHAVARRYQKEPERARLAELAAPAGVREHQIAVSDGGSVYVVEHGPAGPAGPGGGRPVLLLHGVTLSSAVWHYQLRDLAAAGHRVAALDFRGHGRSLAGSEGYTIDRLAADVEEVTAALGFEGLVVAGHSMGGMVALRMLARDPALAAGAGRVGALMLAATSASPVRHRGVPLARGLVAAARPLLMRSAALSARLPGPTLPANDLAFLLARITFGDAASPGEVSFTGSLTSEVPARVSAALVLDIVRFDAEAVLDSIRLPTVVVVGDHDLMTPVSHAKAMAAAIPGSSLEVLAGCGHMVMLERRTEVNQLLTGLAGAGPGPAGDGTEPAEAASGPASAAARPR